MKFSLVAVLGLLLVGHSARGAVRIEIQDDASVGGGFVRLGEISKAEIFAVSVID